MKNYLIDTLDQAKEMYKEYRVIQYEYVRMPENLFNSPMKESTFINRLRKNKKVTIGQTNFIMNTDF